MLMIKRCQLKIERHAMTKSEWLAQKSRHTWPVVLPRFLIKGPKLGPHIYSLFLLEKSEEQEKRWTTFLKTNNLHICQHLKSKKSDIAWNLLS